MTELEREEALIEDCIGFESDIKNELSNIEHKIAEITAAITSTEPAVYDGRYIERVNASRDNCFARYYSGDGRCQIILDFSKIEGLLTDLAQAKEELLEVQEEIENEE